MWGGVSGEWLRFRVLCVLTDSDLGQLKFDFVSPRTNRLLRRISRISSPGSSMSLERRLLNDIARPESHRCGPAAFIDAERWENNLPSGKISLGLPLAGVSITLYSASPPQASNYREMPTLVHPEYLWPARRRGRAPLSRSRPSSTMARPPCPRPAPAVGTCASTSQSSWSSWPSTRIPGG